MSPTVSSDEKRYFCYAIVVPDGPHLRTVCRSVGTAAVGGSDRWARASFGRRFDIDRTHSLPAQSGVNVACHIFLMAAWTDDPES